MVRLLIKAGSGHFFMVVVDGEWDPGEQGHMLSPTSAKIVARHLNIAADAIEETQS